MTRAGLRRRSRKRDGEEKKRNEKEARVYYLLFFSPFFLLFGQGQLAIFGAGFLIGMVCLINPYETSPPSPVLRSDEHTPVAARKKKCLGRRKCGSDHRSFVFRHRGGRRCGHQTKKEPATAAGVCDCAFVCAWANCAR